ncbi:DUF3096 domain-containing protein [Candidatus Woesearchaeota archaeon]|nr:DUF3096 domain-containing protein [Candidatus Woesearchaeota archaeon]
MALGVGFIGSLLALLLGVLILAFPKMLRLLLGLYFIIIGILGLVGWVL